MPVVVSVGLAETLTAGLVETMTVGELLVETDVVGGAVVEELLAVAETVMDVVAVLLARVLPEQVVERLVLGIVDRLVAVLAGGCLLVALLAAEVGGCAARQSMRLWLSCQCDVLILARLTADWCAHASCGQLLMATPLTCRGAATCLLTPFKPIGLTGIYNHYNTLILYYTLLLELL